MASDRERRRQHLHHLLLNEPPDPHRHHDDVKFGPNVGPPAPLPSCAAGRIRIDFDQACESMLGRIPLLPRPVCAGTQALALGVVHQLRDGVPPSGPIIDIDQQSVDIVLHQFGQAADPTRNDGDAGRERLQNCSRCRFVTARRIDKRSSPEEKAGDLIGLDRSREDDLGRRHRDEPLTLWTVPVDLERRLGPCDQQFGEPLFCRQAPESHEAVPRPLPLRCGEGEVGLDDNVVGTHAGLDVLVAHEGADGEKARYEIEGSHRTVKHERGCESGARGSGPAIAGESDTSPRHLSETRLTYSPVTEERRG